MKSQEPDERKTNKMALAGFLLTMAGFLFTIILLPELGLFLVALGMVFCVIGLIQILSNKKKWSGIKLAVAGLVIGTLLILGIIILIALYLG
jgi:ABC-type phosphate transport system permease subunit